MTVFKNVGGGVNPPVQETRNKGKRSYFAEVTQKRNKELDGSLLVKKKETSSQGRWGEEKGDVIPWKDWEKKEWRCSTEIGLNCD